MTRHEIILQLSIEQICDLYTLDGLKQQLEEVLQNIIMNYTLSTRELELIKACVPNLSAIIERMQSRHQPKTLGKKAHVLNV